jgi:hypothetical protein
LPDLRQSRKIARTRLATATIPARPSHHAICLSDSARCFIMLDIDALAASSAWWEVVDKIGVAAVLIGVIGEGLAEWHPARINGWRHWKATARVSWLVLVAGLAIELPAQHMKGSNDALIIAALNDRVEHEKTARAEMEAQFSWRVIQPAQREAIIRKLAGTLSRDNQDETARQSR